MFMAADRSDYTKSNDCPTIYSDVTESDAKNFCRLTGKSKLLRSPIVEVTKITAAYLIHASQGLDPGNISLDLKPYKSEIERFIFVLSRLCTIWCK